MFEKIVNGIETAEKNISGLLNGKKHTAETVKNRMIIFKQDTEQFMGMTGEMLGPFKKGDIANLPVEIVDILTGSDKAEPVSWD